VLGLIRGKTKICYSVVEALPQFFPGFCPFPALGNTIADEHDFLIVHDGTYQADMPV
jgi:hypothetical protein